MSKRFIKIVAIVLAVIMLLSVGMIAVDLLFSDRASARVTQAQIDRLRAERREHERERREIQSRINSIEFERMEEFARKGVLDERISITVLEIENITDTIRYYETLIREKEYDVFLAQIREEEQLELYRNRVRSMEENGVITYLEIIFDSTSFADLLARIDFVADIMRADEQSFNALTMAREDTEAAKEALENTKNQLDIEKLELEEMEADLLTQLEEAEALIRRIDSDLEAERELRALVVAEEERVLREINSAVAELRRQQERERLARQRAQAAARGPTQTVVGTGQLLWPASGPVTSPFGMRFHPVHRVNRFHSGIDIAAPHGAPIIAADSGVVVTATWNSGYGNYIVIDHGNGMQTLYAHNSRNLVSPGQAVSRGQLIGRIGSTGVSTGPHLHFEVIINGTRVNPMLHL